VRLGGRARICKGYDRHGDFVGAVPHAVFVHAFPRRHFLRYQERRGYCERACDSADRAAHRHCPSHPRARHLVLRHIGVRRPRITVAAVLSLSQPSWTHVHVPAHQDQDDDCMTRVLVSLNNMRTDGRSSHDQAQFHLFPTRNQVSQ